VIKKKDEKKEQKKKDKKKDKSRSSSSSSSSLSSGAIAGIVIGVVVGSFLLCLILMAAWRCRGGGKDGKFAKTVDEPSRHDETSAVETNDQVEMGEVAHE